MSIRGGGHGYTCQATKRGGLMIDLRKLRSITIHDDNYSTIMNTTSKSDSTLSFPTIELGTGLRWKDVLLYLQEYQQKPNYQYYIIHGQCTSVGIAGFALHGGVHFGAYSELHGLATDTVVGLTAVLANSSIFQFITLKEKEMATRNSNEEGSYVDPRTVTPLYQYKCTMDSIPMIDSHCEDLVYAFRGAGSSFGIVTSITMKLFPQFPSSGHLQHSTSSTYPQTSNTGISAYSENTPNILHSALSILSIHITDLDGAAQLLKAYIDQIHPSISLTFFGLDAYFKAYLFLLRFAKNKVASVFHDPNSLWYDFLKEDNSTIHFIVEATWLQKNDILERGERNMMLEQLNDLHLEFCKLFLSKENQREERMVGPQSLCTKMVITRPWFQTVEPWSVSSYDLVWGKGHAYGGASITVDQRYELDVIKATLERFVNYTRQKSCSDCVTVLHRVGEGIRRRNGEDMTNIPQSVHPFRLNSTLWIEVDCGQFHSKRKYWSHCSTWVDDTQRLFDIVVPEHHRFHYPNVPNTKTSSWTEQYFGDGYRRLQHIKSIYDPLNLFYHSQSISSSEGINDFEEMPNGSYNEFEDSHCVEIYDDAVFQTYRRVGITLCAILFTGMILRTRKHGNNLILFLGIGLLLYPYRYNFKR